MSFYASFPMDRLDKTANAFRTFDFNVRARTMADKLIPEVTESLSNAAPIGQRYIYPNTSPSPGGALKRSFYGAYEQGGTSSVSVVWRSKVKYAGFVLHGTKPHEIPPGKKGFLFFYGTQKGSWMKLTRAVRHPGTQPNDYALPAKALLADRVPQEWAYQMKSFPF